MNATRAHYSFQGHLAGGKNVLAERIGDSKWKADANAHIPGDNYLEKGDYLRLSSLTLGYTIKNLGGWAESMQIYGTCNNLFTLTGYKGIDPEVNLGGLDPGIDYRESFYPHTRSFIVGVKVNFGSQAAEKKSPVAPMYAANNAEVDRLNGEINRLIAENDQLKNRKPEVKTEVIRSKEFITYPHFVNFNINETNVQDREKVNLQYVAEMIKTVPGKKFSVVGYADKQTGSAERNAVLAQQRAKNVYDVLTQMYGVSADQLTLDAKGGVDTMFLNDPQLSRSVIISEVK
jgi:outer membrane protein OmpA-like peptidoglycan-associated protein